MLSFLRARLPLLTRPRVLAALFLLCALPAGLGCALLTPIGDVSDEPAHIARADGLRLGEVLGSRPPGMPGAGVVMNLAVYEVAVAEVYATYTGTPLPAATRAQARGVAWTDQTIFCPTQMVHYFPVFYLPGALGLAAGKALGLSPLATVFLGRLAMLAAYLALGTLAVGAARRGAVLIFAVLTLPSVLHLAASYNQDGLLIVTCALAAAVLTRGGVAGARVLMALAACAKPPYAVLLLASTRRPWPRQLGLSALAALPAVLWLAVALHGTFSPWPDPPYHPGPLWPGDRTVWLHDSAPAHNLAVLAAHPWAILTLPPVSAVAVWPSIWPDILGKLGWGTLNLPGWMYVAQGIALVCALLGTALEAPPRPGREVALAGVLAAFWAVALSQYLSFSLAGDDIIHALYGRYLLPLLPFLVLILPLRQVEAARGLALLPLAVAVVNIVALPATLLNLYLMAGP